MGGAAWNTDKNKTDEELFEELVIKKNEYYDLDIPTLEQFLEQQGPNPETGMYARWSWYIQKKKEYKKLYLDR